MAKAPNLFPLKLLVISLGLLLVGGMVFLISVVMSKAGEMNAPCKDVTLNITALGIKGGIGSITPQGNTLIVTFLSPEASTVLTLDRCTGKPLQKVSIIP